MMTGHMTSGVRFNKSGVWCCLLITLAVLLSCQARTPPSGSTLGVEIGTTQPTIAPLASTATAIQIGHTSTPSATPLLCTLTPLPPLPTNISIIPPQPLSATPAATPAILEVIAQLVEREVFYTDGVDFPSEIWKLDLSTLEKMQLFYSDEPGFEVGELALSPDKEFIVFTYAVYDPINQAHTHHSGLQMIHIDGLELQTLTEIDEDDVLIGGPIWSPDGNLIAYSRTACPPGGYPCIDHIHILDLDTGRDQTLIEGGVVFAWSPEGDKILYGLSNDNGFYDGLCMFDLDSGGRETLWEEEGLVFGQPAWQPHGEQVAVTVMEKETIWSTDPEARLYLVDVTTKQRRELGKVDAHDIQWSRDGEKLVYFTPIAYRRPTWPTRLWLLDLRGGSFAQLLDTTAFAGKPAWSTNGQALLLVVGEPKAPRWISVMAITDQSLTKLVSTRTPFVSVTW